MAAEDQRPEEKASAAALADDRLPIPAFRAWLSDRARGEG